MSLYPGCSANHVPGRQRPHDRLHALEDFSPPLLPVGLGFSEEHFALEVVVGQQVGARQPGGKGRRIGPRRCCREEQGEQRGEAATEQENQTGRLKIGR